MSGFYSIFRMQKYNFLEKGVEALRFFGRKGLVSPLKQTLYPIENEI